MKKLLFYSAMAFLGLFLGGLSYGHSEEKKKRDELRKQLEEENEILRAEICYLDKQIEEGEQKL